MKAGRDPEELTFMHNVEIEVGDDLGDSTNGLVGSPSTIYDTLRGFQDMGFDGFNFILPAEHWATQLERLASEIAPRLAE